MYDYLDKTCNNPVQTSKKWPPQWPHWRPPNPPVPAALERVPEVWLREGSRDGKRMLDRKNMKLRFARDVEKGGAAKTSVFFYLFICSRVFLVV